MSLEEELTINQFGQGVHSVADMLDEFRGLDNESQKSRFINLYCEVCDADLNDIAIEQALAESSIDATDAIYDYLSLHRIASGSKGFIHIPNTENPPDGSLDAPFTVLLCLFKVDYQRRYVAEQSDSPNWRYWDLSNSDIAEGILTRHRELVDELYHAPGFRSEFVALAKLWYLDKMRYHPGFQEPEPEAQTSFEFFTYDDMVAEARDRNKNMYGRMLLRNSLHKAVTVRYKLATDEANRLVLGVLDRYMGEIYNTGLF